MFEFIGDKIKTVAKVFCIVGIIISVIIASFVAKLGGNGETLAIIIVCLGILISWLSTMILYGYGELIERNAATDDKVRQIWDYVGTISVDIHQFKVEWEKMNNIQKTPKQDYYEQPVKQEQNKETQDKTYMRLF